MRSLRSDDGFGGVLFYLELGALIYGTYLLLREVKTFLYKNTSCNIFTFAKSPSAHEGI